MIKVLPYTKGCYFGMYLTANKIPTKESDFNLVLNVN